MIWWRRATKADRHWLCRYRTSLDLTDSRSTVCFSHPTALLVLESMGISWLPVVTASPGSTLPNHPTSTAPPPSTLLYFHSSISVHAPLLPQLHLRQSSSTSIHGRVGGHRGRRGWWWYLEQEQWLRHRGQEMGYWGDSILAHRRERTRAGRIARRIKWDSQRWWSNCVLTLLPHAGGWIDIPSRREWQLHLGQEQWQRYLGQATRGRVDGHIV